MNRKHILVLTLFTISSIIGVIGIFPVNVRADGPVSYIPTSYQGIKGTYSGGSLENLAEKDSLYFDWNVESQYFPPFFTIYSFVIDFFFDTNVGPVYEILIELSFHQSVSIKVYYGDGSTEFDTTFLGSLIIRPNGKEIVKIRASCTYYYSYNPTCRFNQIQLYPIALISPGNGASFTEPMEGYYPACYGFEDQDNGDSGLDINFFDSVSSFGTCQITGSYTDINNAVHNKVLRLEDPYRGYGMQYKHTLDTTQNIGHVEFWFLMTDKYTSDSDRIMFYAMDQDDYIGFKLTIENEQIIDSQSNTMDINYNTWYHIRIYFQGYSGTNASFDWYVNNKLRHANVLMENNLYTIKTLCIQGDADTKCEAYFDAFGYDWMDGFQENYNVGENFKEGLLLDIEHGNFEDLYYILDDRELVYIRGDTVIPFPFTAQHNITVGGTLDGDEILSETSYFSFTHGDKIAMLFYMEEREGPYLDDIETMLVEKGFTTIYRISALSIGVWNQVFMEVDAMEDGDDIIFLYMAGHGMWSMGDSVVQLGPAFTMMSSSIKDDMDEFESSRKMIMVDACYSGGFTADFNTDSYIAMTSSAWDQTSQGLEGEGIFSDIFFSSVDGGYSSLAAFELARFGLKYYNKDPRISDRCDIDFFGY